MDESMVPMDGCGQYGRELESPHMHDYLDIRLLFLSFSTLLFACFNVIPMPLDL